MLVFLSFNSKCFMISMSSLTPWGVCFFLFCFFVFFTNSVYFQLTSLSVCNLLFYLSVEFFFQKLCIL